LNKSNSAILPTDSPNPLIGISGSPDVAHILAAKSELYHNKKKLTELLKNKKKWQRHHNSSSQVYMVDDLVIKIGESSKGEKMIFEFVNYLSHGRSKFHATCVLPFLPKFVPTGYIFIESKIGKWGSFQQKSNGISLKKILSTPLYLKLINRDPDLQAKLAFLTLYVVALAQFDAHGNNILVDINVSQEQEKIAPENVTAEHFEEPLDVNVTFVLFDNMRSLTHSKFIMWGTEIMIGFRASIFRLQQCHQPHDNNVRKLLQMEIDHLHKKSYSLKKEFLQRPDIAAFIKDLPEGWIYTDYLVRNFRSRLDILQKSQSSCIEMVFDVFPEYKFFAMLVIVNKYLIKFPVIPVIHNFPNMHASMLHKFEKCWRRSLDLANMGFVRGQFTPLYERLYMCCANGVNPWDLFELCSAADFDYVAVIKKNVFQVWFMANIKDTISLLAELDDINDDFFDPDISKPSDVIQAQLEISLDLLYQICTRLSNIGRYLEHIPRYHPQWNQLWSHMVGYANVFKDGSELYKKCIPIVSHLLDSPDSTFATAELFCGLSNTLITRFITHIQKVIEDYNQIIFHKKKFDDEINRILDNFYAQSVADYKDIPKYGIIRTTEVAFDTFLKFYNKTNYVQKLESATDTPSYWLKVDPLVKLDHLTKPGFIINGNNVMRMIDFVKSL